MNTPPPKKTTTHALSPFVQLIEKRKRPDPTVPSWLLVIVVRLESRPEGLHFTLEPRKQLHGELVPFNNTETELYKLEARGFLSQAPEFYFNAHLDDSRLAYYDVERGTEHALSLMLTTLKLWKRRWNAYEKRCGQPDTVGWAAVALAHVLGAHSVYVEYADKNDGLSKYCDSLIFAADQVNWAVYQLQKKLRERREAQSKTSS